MNSLLVDVLLVFSPPCEDRENSAVQDDASVITCVEEQALYCERVARELGPFHKAKKVSKVFRIVG